MSFASLVLISVLAQSTPSTVHVSPTGSDTLGNGSQTAPFRTIQRGVDVVSVGGVVNVAPGPYPTPFSINKEVRVQGHGGRPTLGPLGAPGVIAFVVSSHVDLAGLDFVGGGAGRTGVRISGGVSDIDIADCAYSDMGDTGVDIVASGGSGYRLDRCRFFDVSSAQADAESIRCIGVSGLRMTDCSFEGVDFGARLSSCLQVELERCRFTDLRQAALLAVACPGLMLRDSRITRSAQVPRPTLLAAPADQLGAVSLVSGSDGARIERTVVEACGGFLGRDSFPVGASVAFDGLFAIAVRGSTGVELVDSTVRENEFGGVYAASGGSGLRLWRCNLVANGSRNANAPDVGVFTDTSAVEVASGFWGRASGPVNDGDGPGNGFAGSGATVIQGVAARPYRAAGFRYRPADDVGLGTGGLDLVAADIDGDGIAGLVAAMGDSGQVAVLRHNSAGFQAPQFITVGDKARAVAAGDIDADGFADVAVVDERSDQVVILYGDGAGAFPRQDIVGVPRRPVRIAAGDVDGAPGADLVVASRGDVFAVGGLTVISADGVGGLSTVVLTDVEAPSDVMIAAVNGSGGADLVAYETAPGAAGLLLWAGDGSGNFGAANRIASDADPVSDARVAAFLDGSGPHGVAVSTFGVVPGTDGRLRLLRNDGAGTLLAPVELDESTGPFALGSAAFGAGGSPGVVFAKPATGEVVVFGDFDPGAGVTAPHAELVLTSALPLAIATADLSGDSRADVAVYDGVSGAVQVLRRTREWELEKYGTGCAVASGAPVPGIHAQSQPVLGASTFGVGMHGGPAGAPSFLLAGITSQQQPIFGTCELLLEFPFALTAASDAAGYANVPLPVPDAPALVGGDLFVQWWVVTPPGTALSDLRSSRGLRVRVGG